ncbi:MAG: hypothetical protein A3J35_04415 [Gammaproteobacteria bacterium RIFCSPLOWO2_02_FULL_52_10]|nr:MAG: hypothetical protein A3J35_04415 [Gammaproteobacteria bacterium RIFCSPLOWO2_02_FULL_52_10]
MFKGKTVLITGASSGLGASLAQKFAQAGANLALFALDAEGLQQTADLCARQGATTITATGDVNNPADCQKLVADAVGRFGALDYLILCAGISMWARFEDVADLSVFKKLMDTNYHGVVNFTYYTMPHLRQSKGIIVAISSIQGKIGVPLHTGYVASKHAVQGFFDSLRTELIGSGIHILLVLPHWLRGTNLRKSAIGADGRALGETSASHNSESITLEECSRAILKAMRKRQRELIIPPKLKLLPWLKLISPRLLDYIVSRKVDQQN